MYRLLYEWVSKDKAQYWIVSATLASLEHKIIDLRYIICPLEWILRKEYVACSSALIEHNKVRDSREPLNN